MLRINIGAVYLLHFHGQLGNPNNRHALAQHYLGWALDPTARERTHRAGQGAAITRAAVHRGIDWTMYVLTEGDVAMEKQLKALKNSARLCPVCGRRHPRGPHHVPQIVWRQLELALFEVDDPFGLVPPPARPPRRDWYEISQERRWNLTRVPPPRFDGAVDNVGIAF